MENALGIPRGDVEAALNFFADPDDNSKPYHIFSSANSASIQFNYSEFQKQTLIHDIRGCESKFNLDHDGFQVLRGIPLPQEVDFGSEESIEKQYFPEIQKLLLQTLPEIHYIHTYDYTLRHKDNTVSYGPVTIVHIDQSVTQALDLARKHLPAEAERLLGGRFRIINVWCPLSETPLESYPLAFASCSSIEESDVVPVEHRDENGEIIREVALIRYNETQKWYYLSAMDNSERLLLTNFDSDGVRNQGSAYGGGTPHSAFKDARTRADAEPRYSIEVRSLVFSESTAELGHASRAM